MTRIRVPAPATNAVAGHFGSTCADLVLIR
jgi:hypothetical protein